MGSGSTVYYEQITEMMRGTKLTHVDRHRETFNGIEIWSFLFRAENRKYGSRAARMGMLR